MAHPYSGHSQNAVGHRRAKLLTTGKQYARGGGHSDEAEDKKLIKRMLKKHESMEGEMMSEEKAAGGRLDKRARGGGMKHGPDCQCAACGGAQKRARGGGIHQITPSKRKPHTNINIINVNRRPRPKPVLPPIGGGGGLPAIGAPAMPPGAGLPLGRPPGMAKGGRMRKGKDYGQGSGEGRLEEFRHMRGK